MTDYIKSPHAHPLLLWGRLLETLAQPGSGATVASCPAPVQYRCRPDECLVAKGLWGGHLPTTLATGRL